MNEGESRVLTERDVDERDVGTFRSRQRQAFRERGRRHQVVAAGAEHAGKER
jgi:hypothetical protein